MVWLAPFGCLLVIPPPSIEYPGTRLIWHFFEYSKFRVIDSSIRVFRLTVCQLKAFWSRLWWIFNHFFLIKTVVNNKFWFHLAKTLFRSHFSHYCKWKGAVQIICDCLGQACTTSSLKGQKWAAKSKILPIKIVFFIENKDILAPWTRQKICTSSTRVPGYSRKTKSSTQVFELRVVWNHYCLYYFRSFLLSSGPFYPSSF